MVCLCLGGLFFLGLDGGWSCDAGDEELLADAEFLCVGDVVCALQGGDCYVVACGDGAKGIAFDDDVLGIVRGAGDRGGWAAGDGRGLGEGCVLALDDGLEGGIDLEDFGVEALAGFFEGGLDAGIFEGDFADLDVFLFEIGGEGGEGECKEEGEGGGDGRETGHPGRLQGWVNGQRDFFWDDGTYGTKRTYGDDEVIGR